MNTAKVQVQVVGRCEAEGNMSPLLITILNALVVVQEVFVSSPPKRFVSEQL